MRQCIEYVPPKIGRRFWSILLISVAFHAGVLVLRGVKSAQKVELPPLMATLRAINPVSPMPVEPIAQAMPVASTQQLMQRTTKPEPRLSSAMTSSTGTVVTHAEQVPNVASAALAETSATPSAVTTSAVVPAAVLAPSQDDLLSSYRRRLTDVLARQQEYPRIAAMRGWEGEVRVRVRVARKGSLLGVSIDHSSGYDILDKHAIAMLEGLEGLPALPEEYGSSELQVVVPVSYSLRKPS